MRDRGARMSGRELVRGVGGMMLAGCAGTARACTVCDSATGHAVRARIFDGHFVGMAAMLLAPFPVFAAAGVWLYLCLPVGGPEVPAGNADLPVGDLGLRAGTYGGARG